MFLETVFSSVWWFTVICCLLAITIAVITLYWMHTVLPARVVRVVAFFIEYANFFSHNDGHRPTASLPSAREAVGFVCTALFIATAVGGSVIGLTFVFSYSAAANDASSVDFANIARSTQLLPVCTTSTLIPDSVAFNFTAHAMAISATFIGFNEDCSNSSALTWSCAGGCSCIGVCPSSSATLGANDSTCVVQLSGVFRFNQQSVFVLSTVNAAPIPTFESVSLTIKAPMIENGTLQETNSTAQYSQASLQSSPLITFSKHFVITRDQAERDEFDTSLYIWTDPQPILGSAPMGATNALMTVSIVADPFFTYNEQTELLGRAEAILFLIVGLIALYEVIHVAHRIFTLPFSCYQRKNHDHTSESEPLLRAEVN